MKSRLKCVGVLASLSLALMAGLPGRAIAQQATLYEIVENLDVVKLVTTGHRVSNWTAQGTAEAGSPFCPAALLPPGVPSCTITAFGRDDIDLAALTTSFIVGTVWANIVAVANLDNVVDAPEAAAFSGQITGDIIVLQPDGSLPVEADLGKNKSVLGPSLPLIYVINGKFFPDASPTIRTSPPAKLPKGSSSEFDSTFRLPFKVAKDGVLAKPERGQNAYYLGDDGSLIKVDQQDEFALGFPLLRAEVFFK
jgi:hypothetical protein